MEIESEFGIGDFAALALQRVLPLRAVIVTLQCTSKTTLPVLHQVAVYSFLKRLADHPKNWSDLIRIDTPESGKTVFPKGYCYRFEVIALAGGEQILNRLLTMLKQLPRNGATEFQRNWKLNCLNDSLSGRLVSTVAELDTLDAADLKYEATRWQHLVDVRIDFQSPARVYRRKPEGANKRAAGQEYCSDAEHLDADLFFSRLQDAMIRHRKNTVTPARQSRPNATLTDCHVFWLDCFYRDASKKVVPTGGMAGWIQLKLDQGMAAGWWQLMVLGQFTGIGKSTSFGWGRYRLRSDKRLPAARASAAQSIAHWVLEKENLASAWAHVASGADRSPFIMAEQTSDQEFDEQPWLLETDNTLEPYFNESHEQEIRVPVDSLRAAMQDVFNGTYTVPELNGYLIEKPGGGFRPLAVPPFKDRVLQRATGQVLTPALDKLMNDRSHGFRPGRSRMTARDAIEAAWRDGYRWAFESDIRDFFDSVQHARLADRLRALYNEDPMVDAILRWMAASVRFDGQLIGRTDGLPQGSPLSPLMANLMLDDFDNDMTHAGFRLVRFADDFVVLCKTAEQARDAAIAAEKSLAEHGFSLHPDKTAITSMADGFRYLGYLFVGDFSIDIGGKKSPEYQRTTVSTTDQPQTNSLTSTPVAWLRSLHSAEQPQSLHTLQAATDIAKRLEFAGSGDSIAERARGGELIVISGAPALVCTDNRRLKVVRKDKTQHLQPWRNVQSVLLFGPHQVTTQAAHAAMMAGVSIHMANGYGRYHGALVPAKPTAGHRLWLAQTARFSDDAARLYCTRQVIISRLRHCREMLRQKKNTARLGSFDGALSAIEGVDNIDSLRGIEGNATREYFAGIGELLDGRMEFTSRNRRPPADPFNCLLSLGYQLLFGYCDAITRTTGLLPWEGFYHRGEGSHPALISDLIEPFRHIVERSAVTAVMQKKISPANFDLSSAGTCIMHNEARRQYLAMLVSRMQISTRARGEAHSLKITEHIRRQSLSLKRFITHGERFVSWRML